MTEETNDVGTETEQTVDPMPAQHIPTVQEARAMFLENPGLSSVVTDEGNLFRDGTLVAVPVLTGA